jgi:hypothetical protein
MEVYTPTKEDFQQFVANFNTDNTNTNVCIESLVNDGFREFVAEKRRQIAIEWAKNNVEPDEFDEYENVVVEFGPSKKRPAKPVGTLIDPAKRWILKVPEYSKTFAPFADIETVIQCHKFTPEKEAQIRALYTPPPSETIVITKKSYDVPDDPLHVFVNFKVSKGSVKIKITVPMEPVIEYQKKAKLAPLPVRLKAYKAFGYPESVLLKMIEHDDKMNKKEPELTKFINSIFGEVTKKVSKPKVKSMYEVYSKQTKKMIDKYDKYESENENENEDE